MIRMVGACLKLKKSMNCGQAWRRLPSRFWGISSKFGRGGQDYRVVGRNRRLLEGNPYWSPELDARLGSFERERYVTLMPVALGKSQDYLGRVRWTLFGNSEQGPERAFWQSFYTAPKKEIPVSESLAFVSNLLSSVYGETTRTVEDLLQLGFRILPAGQGRALPVLERRSAAEVDAAFPHRR